MRFDDPLDISAEQLRIATKVNAVGVSYKIIAEYTGSINHSSWKKYIERCRHVGSSEAINSIYKGYKKSGALTKYG